MKINEEMHAAASGETGERRDVGFSQTDNWKPDEMILRFI